MLQSKLGCDDEIEANATAANLSGSFILLGSSHRNDE